MYVRMYSYSVHSCTYVLGYISFIFCRLLPKHVDHGLEGGMYVCMEAGVHTNIQTVQLLLLATHTSLLYVCYVCAHVCIVTIPQA